MDDLALANKRLSEAGVYSQNRVVDGIVEHRFVVPLRDGRHVAFMSRVQPRVEIGASFGAKLKRKLKKVAKSKAFRKFVKASAFIAPFAAAPAMLVSGVGAAKRAAKKAPAPKKAAPPKRAAPPKKKAAPPPKRAAAPKKAAPPKRAAPKAAARLAPAPITKQEAELAVEVDPTTNEPMEPETLELEPVDDGASVEPEEGVIDTTAEEVTDDAPSDEAPSDDEAAAQEDVAEEVGALLRASDQALAQAGVQARSRWNQGRFEYQYLVPLADGRMVSFSATMQPVVEIGAGKIARKIKRGIKKVAKSKAFGKVLKGLGSVAKLVPLPGASALGKGIDLAAKAQKAAQKGKSLFGGKKKKKVPAGKPAAALRAAAMKTAVKPKPKLTPTRPLTANKGTLVQLDNGRRALVTFV